MSDKERIDVALVQRGLAQSRARAQALVMAGAVYVGEQRAGKPSDCVGEDDVLTVRQSGTGYVSRGALKLSKGLEVFDVQVRGVIAMDLGASTGGFTDVLLRGGAAHVYAVDVGYGQLDWTLRNDARVTVMERTNARYLKKEDFAMRPTLAVMDVSFISVKKILPAAVTILGEAGQFISLIKPQFEAGRERVGKKGVVRDAQVHEDVLTDVMDFVREQIGWEVCGLTFSPIRGPEGNIEFLVHLLPRARAKASVSAEDIRHVVREAHKTFACEGGMA